MVNLDLEAIPSMTTKLAGAKLLFEGGMVHSDKGHQDEERSIDLERAFTMRLRRISTLDDPVKIAIEIAQQALRVNLLLGRVEASPQVEELEALQVDGPIIDIDAFLQILWPRLVYYCSIHGTLVSWDIERIEGEGATNHQRGTV